MIDIEDAVLPPAILHQQNYFPQTSPQAAQEFERRYYAGYASTYLAAIAAARREGWQTISVYGWSPVRGGWWGLPNVSPDIATDWSWTTFGRPILDAVDIVNDSVYCYYWSSQNVAYVLANIDLNVARLRAVGSTKRVRPYTWTLLHGGDAVRHWWTEQPLPNEEERAIATTIFFTGVDGFNAWNWSGTESLNTVALRRKGEAGATGDPGWEYLDVVVGSAFDAMSDSGASQHFSRYDALHVLGLDDKTHEIRFQRILPTERDLGLGPQSAVYSAASEELLPHLRPRSDPIAALIEGMALAKAFEFILRYGEVKIDVAAQTQFAEELPIVRRVKIGPLHVLVTYDPTVVHGGQPRDVILDDFDGIPGLHVSLPADAETRIFVLEAI
jgi:hypothetical protein